MAHALTRVGIVFRFWLEAADLTPTSIVGFHGASEALVAERASVAIDRFGGVGTVAQASGRGVDAAWAGHHLARWTNSSGGVGGGDVVVEAEVLGLKSLDLFGLTGRFFLGQGVWIVFVFALRGKALIAAAHLVVGNHGRDALLHQLLDVGIAVVTSIGGDQGRWRAVGKALACSIMGSSMACSEPEPITSAAMMIWWLLSTAACAA